MRRVASWIGKGLVWAGTFLLIVISIPLLVMLVVLSRPILVAVAVAGLVTVPVLAICSQRFREWFTVFCQQPVHYVRHQGLRFTENIAVHPCHSWARILGHNVNIGVDDFVQSTLGPVEEVELPRVGTRCFRGEPLFTLRRGDRVLQVRSPLSGTVEAINGQLRDFPRLINQTPFTEGWAVCLRAERMEQESEGLLRGEPAHDWFRSEVDRLIGRLMPCETIGSTLQDGGELTGNLHNLISDRDWHTLTRDFFDTPSVLNQPVHTAPSDPL